MTAARRRTEPLLFYPVLGCCFGIALMKSEAVSWFRIQELLRFRSMHFIGVFASAVVTTRLGILATRKWRLRAVTGAPVMIPPKLWGTGARYAIGGTLFGIGWAVTGACPGSLFTLLGAGSSVVLIPFVGALLGAFAYGWLRPRLPH